MNADLTEDILLDLRGGISNLTLREEKRSWTRPAKLGSSPNCAPDRRVATVLPKRT